jgi:hypothetical protein
LPVSFQYFITSFQITSSLRFLIFAFAAFIFAAAVFFGLASYFTATADVFSQGCSASFRQPSFS